MIKNILPSVGCGVIIRGTSSLSYSSSFIIYNCKDKSKYKRIKKVLYNTVNLFSSLIAYDWIVHYHLCFEGI